MGNQNYGVLRSLGTTFKFGFGQFMLGVNKHTDRQTNERTDGHETMRFAFAYMQKCIKPANLPRAIFCRPNLASFRASLGSST